MDNEKIMEQRRAEILEEIYAKKPAPNSFQWQRAVALGAQPDYSPSDEGMEYENTNL